MSGYKICPECDAKNNPDVDECTECCKDLTNVGVIRETPDGNPSGTPGNTPEAAVFKLKYTRTCEDCGTENPVSAEKCAKCGEVISDISPTPATALSETAETQTQCFLESADGYNYEVKDGAVIGRERDMRVYLGKKTFVSRVHARLSIRGNQFFIENLSKTNKTFINGEEITQKIQLKNGDEIGLGGRSGDGERAAYFKVRLSE